MSRELDFDGTVTVTAVENGAAMLVPVEDVTGGAGFSIPAERLPLDGDPVGVVLRGMILGELGPDSDELLVEVRVVGRARKIRLKLKAGHWEVRAADGQKIAISVPEGLSQANVQRAQQADFWFFDGSVPDVDIPGHFADLSGFLAEQEERQRSEKERQEGTRWIRSRNEYDPESFINPYNFVPLPNAGPERREPPGHALRQPGLLHGRIDVKFTAKSPVLVRDTDSGKDKPSRLPRRQGKVVIPGSSVKGALRSAFEAVTGSCLRVVDLDFVPAYRDVLRASNRSGWSLIEVVAVDRESRPTRIRKSTGDPVWYSFDVLKSVLGETGVRPGARFDLIGQPKRVGIVGKGGRLEVRDREAVARTGRSAGDAKTVTVLVTDVRARPRKKGTCFVGAELSENDLSVKVDPVGWSRFEAACDGGQDVKRGTDLNLDAQGDVRVEINNLSQGIAFRQVQGVVKGNRGKVGLRPGNVLWARIAAGEIMELAFSQTWRHGATGQDVTLASRIPESFHPCTGSDGLCPACRVFGSANTAGRRDQEESAYRGHVRFEDLSVAGPVAMLDLAPLGAPRPGSGQMYLEDLRESGSNKTRALEGKNPLREWGSELDSQSPRRVRGRKFYWRTSDAPDRPPRYQAHRSQAGKQNKGNLLKQVEVISTGATISGTLVFENLTPENLGALVSALDPKSLSDHQEKKRADRTGGEFCLSIGGGKPLGLGALACSDLRITLEGAAERYRGVAAQQSESEDLVRAFVESADPSVQRTWPDLMELLRWDAVNPAMVSYPRANPWPDNPRADADDLHEPGFDWWQRSAGMPPDGIASNNEEQQAKHSYVALPTATADRITMPIDIEDESSPDQGHRGGRR